MTQPQQVQEHVVRLPLGRAVLRISPDMIVSMLAAQMLVLYDHNGRELIVQCDLPADAKALRAWPGCGVHIGDQGDVCLMVESASLPPVVPGEPAPEISVTIAECEPVEVGPDDVDF